MTNKLFYLATLPFEAACQINILPKSHPAAQMHGHSYSASVRVQMPDTQTIGQDQTIR